MNKIVLILFTFLLSLGSLSAAPDSLYFRANENYQSGEFEAAIKLYMKVIENGYESSALYYNLGNSFFRSNKLGKAKVNYEKALKLDPRNEDARANLAFTETLVVDKFEDVPEIFIKKWIKAFANLSNSDGWALTSILTFILTLLLFSFYLLLRNMSLRKYGFYGGIIFLFISVSAFFFSWKQRQNELIPSAAIVIEPLVNVKSTPRETGTDLFVLHEGAKVWLEDEAGGWQEIRLSDGRKGWLPVITIENI